MKIVPKVRKVRNKVNKVKKTVRAALSTTPKLKYYYEVFCKTFPVNDKLVLLDSFNGRGITDSSYAVLQEMVSQGLDRTYDIYYVSKDIERDQLFVDENNLPVKLVNPDTRVYTFLLATAGHLLTNTSFPAYFIRRPGQIVVDTWHGTPLKTLGKQMRLGMQSMFYAQHTFMQCNWLTFPNEFTRDVMMRDYNIERLYTGKVAMVGYPRNTILLQGRNDELCSAYELDGYTNFAYMPTWRGKSTQDINLKSYATEAMDYLSALDESLADDQRVYVNFHPMVADSITLDSFEHILPFPKEVNTYVFLSQMDALITDYSSVMFDYALTRRPIILFTYDEDEYLHDRGLYIPLAELPFKKVDTIDELKECIASGTYRERSKEDEEFYEQFIKYDSPENTRTVLNLLLGNDVGDTEIIDYSVNKEHTWTVVNARPQKSLADINGIFLSSDPDDDVILLSRAGFGPDKSKHVADNYLDGYNFIFVTSALPRTFVEEVTKRFWAPTRERLAIRERQRVFADLPTRPEERTTYLVAAQGTSYKTSRSLNLLAVYQPAGSKLALAWDPEGYAPKSILLITKRNIRWTRDLTDDERSRSIAFLDVASFAYDRGLKAGNGTRTRVCLLVEEEETGELFVANLFVGNDSEEQTANYKDPFVIDCSEETLSPLYDEDGMVGVPLIDKADDRVCAVVPYESTTGLLSLLFRYEGVPQRPFVRPVMTSVKTPQQRYLVTTIQIEKGDYNVEAVEIRNRMQSSDTVYPLDFTLSENDEHRIITAKLDPVDLVYDGLYWDFFIVVTDMEGNAFDYRCPSADALRHSMFFRNLQCDLGDGNILFPFRSTKGRIALCHREIYPSDTSITKLKEWAAFFAYYSLLPYWKRKRIWLVYEKFCSLAEDNGYAFFRYCMEDAPKEALDHVYYVIKKDQPEYANVERYGSNVIDFMSFRHMLYVLAADIYVGSDAKSHLYQWRPKTSIIRRLMGRRKVFFLQHGVTAMKRVDYLFGKKGSTPMTYFLTTSPKEQEIVTEHFGYDERHAPMLGFSRWDVLENHADKSHPTILLMPTWRQWLEDVGDEAFLNSDYYKAYAAFIQDERLHNLLNASNATLKFFIHPKLSAELKHFNSGSEHVQLIEMGSAPLNQIIMECSALITDYSSVAWDVLYMDKPVVFFQFDQDRYCEEVGSYIDLNEELPGPICMDLDQLFSALEQLIHDEFTLGSEYEEKLEGWFIVKDTNNRQRTYDYLISQKF